MNVTCQAWRQVQQAWYTTAPQGYLWHGAYHATGGASGWLQLHAPCCIGCWDDGLCVHQEPGTYTAPLFSPPYYSN